MDSTKQRVHSNTNSSSRVQASRIRRLRGDVDVASSTCLWGLYGTAIHLFVHP